MLNSCLTNKKIWETHEIIIVKRNHIEKKSVKLIDIIKDKNLPNIVKRNHSMYIMNDK